MASRKREPKKSSNPATTRKKYENSINAPVPVKQQKDQRKVTELKNPRDTNIDKEEAAKMNIQFGTTREAFSSLKRKADPDDCKQSQHGHATHLLPQRKNQNRDTLSIRGNVVGIEEGDDLRKQLIARNEVFHSQRGETTFALEELVSLNLLSTRTPTIDDRQRSLANQYRERDENFMKSQLIQLSRSSLSPNILANPSPTTVTTPSTSTAVTVTREVTKKRRVTKKEDDVGGGGTVSTASVKISFMFNGLNDIFCYERRASIDHKKYIFGLYDADKKAREEEFFKDDRLEDETPYFSLPSQFKLFHNLVEVNMKKYQARARSTENASSMVPKTNLEEINRDYVRQFRMRPRPGQQLCSMGTQCYFYTFSPDPEVRYIGQVFRTPSQLDAYNKSREWWINSDKFDCNVLCIDCLLVKWTKECMDNIAKERSQKLPINHFTLLVGEGEYNASCMLDCVFNKLSTGIVGCVPEYDAKKRTVEIVTYRPQGSEEIITEKIIGEIGMDF
jgi:hypothetical protein